jgi:hypothetical protein
LTLLLVLLLIGAQAEGVTIPEAVAMETVVVETVAIEPTVEMVIEIALRSETTVAPEASIEARVDPQPEASTQVIVREAMTEDATPLCSVPMTETRS